jgi:hypothetical protein
LIAFRAQAYRVEPEIVLATAVGDSSDYCKVQAEPLDQFGNLWGKLPAIRCYSRTGSAASEGFNVFIDYQGNDCEGAM